MNYSKEIKEGVLRLHFSGDLIGESNGPELVELANDAISTGVTICMLNISDVRYINSSGIGVLITLLTKFRNKNGDLYIIKPSEHVNKLLMQFWLVPLGLRVKEAVINWMIIVTFLSVRNTDGAGIFVPCMLCGLVFVTRKESAASVGCAIVSDCTAFLICCEELNEFICSECIIMDEVIDLRIVFGVKIPY